MATARVAKDKGEMGEILVKDAVATANEAIKSKGVFTLGIAGGSLPSLLQALPSAVDSAQGWHVAFVDERCVGHDAEESNLNVARSAFLQSLEKKGATVYAIDNSLAEQGEAAVEQAAQDYEAKIKGVPELPRSGAGYPEFDLLLLGMGPDGHICSLFPGKDEIGIDDGRWILPVHNSPKPPAGRITFSLPAVNAARKKRVATAGAGKAEAVGSALSGTDKSLPASLVEGDVAFFLDEEAAARVPSA